MKRVVWHWTGGGNTANDVDRRAYHHIVNGDGTVVNGVHPHSANARIDNPWDASTYAAHVARLNTGSIGTAVAGMGGAVERPFTPGPRPINMRQVEVLARLTAEHCRQYGIPVSRETTLSHAEVQPTLGVAQRFKWDLIWLPDMEAPGDALAVGDRLRAMVAAVLRESPPAASTEPRRGLSALWQRLRNRGS